METRWSAWESLGKAGRDVSGLVVGENQDGRLEVFVGADRTTKQIWQTRPGGEWSDWQQLGDGSIHTNYESLGVGRNLDGRLEVFTLSPPGETGPDQLWNIWQKVPNGHWSDWGSLGRPVGEGTSLGFFEHRNTKRRIAVGSNQDGRLEVFVQDWGIAELGGVLAAHFAHVWQTAPNNGWSGWRNAGRPPVPATGAESSGHPFNHQIASNRDGRLELFTLGAGFGPWQIWQTSPNNGWSNWKNADPDRAAFVFLDLAIGENADGRLEMFVVHGGTSVSHTWQTAPNNGWSGWASLGAPPVSGRGLEHLAVAQNVSGRLEVFVLAETESAGNEGSFWHIWQTGNGWSEWHTLGSPPTKLKMIPATSPASAVARNADGRLELFVADRDDAVWHTWQV